MRIDSALATGAARVGRHDALLLLCHATGLTVSRIYMCKEMEFDGDAYLEYLDRRMSGEPLQYIIRSWEFMGLEFITDRRALIPRQETELLVEEVLKIIKLMLKTDRQPRVLDVCTGSGCIAVSIALRGGADVIALDISDDALSLARENALKHGLLPDGVTFVKSDLLDEVRGEFDVIVSNPPYIPSSEMKNLSPTITNYEPTLALDGGVDGMDFYRRLIPQCKEKLAPGGRLVLEIGPGEVRSIIEENAFTDICVLNDYAGAARIISAMKPLR